MVQFGGSTFSRGRSQAQQLARNDPAIKKDQVPIMSRMSRIAIPLAILALAFAAAPAPAEAHTSPSRTVCLDAGHGGGDSGARYYGLDEADQNLLVVEFLAPLLRNSGYGVALTRTRENNVNLGNSERAAVCNAAGADTVVSVHMNAASNPSIDYFKAFYGKRNKDASFADAISANYRLPKPAPATSGFVTVNPTGQFASGLLLKSTGHAVLAETIFISNQDEAAALSAGIQDSTYSRHRAIAEQLFAGINAWYATH